MHNLRADQLGYHFQERPVFTPVNFNLQPGQLMALRGANGSGKTTLLQILAGLRPHYSGQLFWGQSKLPKPDYKEQVLYIGHKNALQGQLSLTEMMHYYSLLYGEKTPANITPLLRDFDLHNKLHLPINTLSAGQQRKVSLLRLGLIPRYLWLLDEPYSNLDQHTAGVLDALVRDHQHHGGLALIATHHALPHTTQDLELTLC
jgi:heme exporter protein A